MRTENTVEFAGKMLKRMVKHEALTVGQENALSIIGRRVLLEPSTVYRLMRKELKAVSVDAFVRIRKANIAICEAQIRALQDELEASRGSLPDDVFSDFEIEIEALAGKVKSSKERLKEWAS